MRPKDIQVGKIYRNRGKGRTFRRVVAIGDEHRPTRWFSDYPPKEPGVLYRDQVGRENRPYLSSFAQWCKEEEIRVCRELLSVGGEMSRDFWLAFLFFLNVLCAGRVGLRHDLDADIQYPCSYLHTGCHSGL